MAYSVGDGLKAQLTIRFLLADWGEYAGGRVAGGRDGLTIFTEKRGGDGGDFSRSSCAGSCACGGAAQR